MKHIEGLEKKLSKHKDNQLMVEIIQAEKRFLDYHKENGHVQTLAFSANGFPSVESLKADLQAMCKIPGFENIVEKYNSLNSSHYRNFQSQITKAGFKKRFELLEDRLTCSSGFEIAKQDEIFCLKEKHHYFLQSTDIPFLVKEQTKMFGENNELKCNEEFFVPKKLYKKARTIDNKLNSPVNFLETLIGIVKMVFDKEQYLDIVQKRCELFIKDGDLNRLKKTLNYLTPQIKIPKVLFENKCIEYSENNRLDEFSRLLKILKNSECVANRESLFDTSFFKESQFIELLDPEITKISSLNYFIKSLDYKEFNQTFDRIDKNWGEEQTKNQLKNLLDKERNQGVAFKALDYFAENNDPNFKRDGLFYVLKYGKSELKYKAIQYVSKIEDKEKRIKILREIYEDKFKSKYNFSLFREEYRNKAKEYLEKENASFFKDKDEYLEALDK